MNLVTQRSRSITQRTQRVENKFQILCARRTFFVFLVLLQIFETASQFFLYRFFINYKPWHSHLPRHFQFCHPVILPSCEHD